jgi:hypothetical protein
MLSCMTTSMGVTIIGPNGQPLHLPASSPAFRAGKELLVAGLPNEQTWNGLHELLADPLKALSSWCARFGVTLGLDADVMKLDDVRLSFSRWRPYLSRLEETGGAPQTAMRLAQALGAGAEYASIQDVCLLVEGQKSETVKVMKLQQLPEVAEPGDRVLKESNSGAWFMVSYEHFKAGADNTLELGEGKVYSRVLDGFDELALAKDVLLQPCILGFDRTYRCEQGNADGWLHDLLFDSLAKARSYSREILDHATPGTEVRIINRITHELVSFI